MTIMAQSSRKEIKMADVQVTCIIKPHPQSPHEHITHLGNQPTWLWTREQVTEDRNPARCHPGLSGTRF